MFLRFLVLCNVLRARRIPFRDMLKQSRVTEKRVRFVVPPESLKMNKVSSIQLSQQGHFIRV
jgi:hypothetical protein